ncbi:myb-like HTH transcriptional regulator family protein [Perilla frutescens var. frutescens]|nr:myb-like HTH transcriptional regulator family protein [Perilla frutescens var. frutescens]
MDNQQRFDSLCSSSSELMRSLLEHKISLMQPDQFHNLSDCGVNDCNSPPSCSELLKDNGSAIPRLFRPLKAADFQSRDSLQSLVQYCINANHGLRLQHETSVLPGESIPRCKQIIGCLQNKPMPESSSNLNHCINVQSFDKNLGFPQQVGNYQCSSKSKLKKQGRVENAAMNRSKARVCWTTDLHKKFVRSVDLLGGARKATPKAILTLMNCDGLTIFHIKSHLQKYRVAQLMSEATKENVEQFHTETHTGLKILEALKLQMDFQRLLHKQLESQKKLQLRIEEQAKQLRSMIQCQMS